ncbi:MAG TPA: lysophospholipid acyltransferase family protein [Thermoleophilaceae bacterium]|nr:lysophospholipid acyltransferase family protein [Thermoleophilaceae bacterium]
MSDAPRRRPSSRRGLRGDSPLLGGPLSVDAGAEEPRPSRPDWDSRSSELDIPRPPEPPAEPDPRELRNLIPAADVSREVDDWGRSQRVFDLVEPLLDLYYRYWFRVDVAGIEHVPDEGGALLVSNHSGALPPDAPMIMQAIRHEHPRSRPLYMLGEHWFKGYPGVGLLANKIGLVSAHPENAQRLLGDEQRLALVFPEGQKASRKLYWQRYKLRRFGRGGFVRTAMRAGVPIVPVAVVGAEEAMPIFAHVPLLQRLTGLIYFPINHAFPHFGLAAGAMYLPAKFKIRFLEPLHLSGYGPDDADDVSLVQTLAEDVRGRIQAELDSLLRSRKSVWFG